MTCVFGIFFVDDMPAAVRHLWRLVRPGGRRVITAWGPRVLEPGNTAFWNAVRNERPDLHKAFNPWERINDPSALSAMFLEARLYADHLVPETGSQPLKSPEDFWTIALGSGYRNTIEQLSAIARERVRQATLDHRSQNNVRNVETNALYAMIRKRSSATPR